MADKPKKNRSTEPIMLPTKLSRVEQGEGDSQSRNTFLRVAPCFLAHYILHDAKVLVGTIWNCPVEFGFVARATYLDSI